MNMWYHTIEEVIMMTIYEMAQAYEKHSFSSKYIKGFIFKSMVYMVMENSLNETGLKLDKASRNGGYSLRFKPNLKEKKEMLKKAFPICTKQEFIALVKASKYNQGEMYEKVITEHFGLKWKKDNIPFTKKGDIEINGIAYQIKFEKATFINEKNLIRIN